MGSGAVTGGSFGGGADMGNAQGTVTINMADLQRAAQTARTLSRQIEQSFSGISGGVQRVERSIGGLGVSLQSLGVAFGVRQLAQFAINVNELATAYTRQNVAALSLAGSQEKLNALLASYDKVTGGAIGKAQALSAVTQLQAIGFADSTAELERFVTAARGISLATGRPQEFVQQQLQFELSNQTGFRLDQIGLDLNEVKNKADELRSANSSLSESMAYQNAILDLATQKYGKLVRSVEGQSTGLEKARKGWADLSLQMGETFGPATGAALTGMANRLNLVTKALQDIETQAKATGAAIRGANLFEGKGSFLALDWLMSGKSTSQFLGHLGETPSGGRRITASNFGGGSMPSGMAPEFTGEQLAEQRDAKLDFEQETQEIERSAQEQRLDATRSYESQRTSTIATYERTIAREAEDFGRQRARAQAQFQKQIAEMAESVAEREADMAEDLADRIADLQGDSAGRIADAQEDTAKRISEIEEDYRKNRERAERDHRDNLLDAAARLDATAVFNEQKRFARESADAKDAHDEAISDAQEGLQERIDQERENLAERIAQEQEAHAERLQDAREADAERLADMQADFAEQQRLEDEDRAIRLQRMAEDQAEQLASMAMANAEQMAEIDRQEAEELKSAQEAHLKELEAAGLFNKQYKAIQEQRDREALQRWDLMWQQFNARMTPQGAPTPGQLQQNQWGGANLLNPVPLTSPVSNRGGDTQILNVQAGAISVYAAPGQSAEDIASTIDEHLVRRFRELAN